MLCPESRMYQLELAGLEIFHWLDFPERSPLLPLSGFLLNALFLFTLQPHHFISPKTTCEDKPFICTLNKTRVWTEGKENRMYEASVVATRGNGYFLHFPISFILSHREGGENRVVYHGGESRRTQKKNTGRKCKDRREGEGEERQKKIKNASRAEAGRKPPVGLSAGKLTSNCL